MAKITLSLLENSESFLKEALHKAILAEKRESEWKFALFNLVQAIELALKERLRREHPLLVYADIDNPKLSVSLERALGRLSQCPTVGLNQDDIKNVRLAASIRNSITHHEVDVSIEQVKSIFASLLGFLSEFSERHLNTSLATKVPKHLWKKAISAKLYASELYRRAEQRFEREKIDKSKLITCIRCWHDTFVTSKRRDSCYLCGFAEPMTVCQECGIGMFESEGYKVYYGKWSSGNKTKPTDWYPHLCEKCHEDYLEHGIRPLRN